MMWIPPSQADASQSPGFNSAPHESVQSMFVTTKCYDLIGASNKVIIFETSITMQQAFVALAEHGRWTLFFLLL